MVGRVLYIAVLQFLPQVWPPRCLAIYLTTIFFTAIQEQLWQISEKACKRGLKYCEGFAVSSYYAGLERKKKQRMSFERAGTQPRSKSAEPTHTPTHTKTFFESFNIYIYFFSGSAKSPPANKGFVENQKKKNFSICLFEKYITRHWSKIGNFCFWRKLYRWAADI